MNFKNFEEFKGVLISDLQESAKERGGYIRVEEIFKRNKTVTGIHFHKESDCAGTVVRPILYAECAYEDYIGGTDYQDILSAIIRDYLVDDISDDFNGAVNDIMAVLSDKESLLEKVLCCFVREAGNEMFMEQFITADSPLEGLRLFFYVTGMIDMSGVNHTFSVSVKKDVLEDMGISIEELCKAALENTKDVSAIYPMELVLLASLGLVELPVSSVLSKSRGDKYCMTNCSQNKMSSSVLSKAYLLAEFLEDDLYIAMRTLNEAIAVPAGLYTVDTFNEFIMDVYQEVPDTEYLTDMVYVYSRKNGTFKKV